MFNGLCKLKQRRAPCRDVGKPGFQAKVGCGSTSAMVQCPRARTNVIRHEADHAITPAGRDHPSQGWLNASAAHIKQNDQRRDSDMRIFQES